MISIGSVASQIRTAVNGVTDAVVRRYITMIEAEEDLSWKPLSRASRASIDCSAMFDDGAKLDKLTCS